MNEEPTRNLTGGDSFENRVLAEFAKLNNRMASFETRMTSFEGRLTSLEEKVDARLHDTRPIWETVLTRLDAIETRLDGIETRLTLVDSKMDVLNHDLLEMRGEVNLLKKRVPPAA